MTLEVFINVTLVIILLMSLIGIEDGKVERAHVALVPKVDVVTAFEQQLDGFYVAILRGDVHGGITVVVGRLQGELRLDQHIKDVYELLVLRCHVHHVVPVLVLILNVDAMFGKESHDATIPANTRDPKRI